MGLKRFFRKVVNPALGMLGPIGSAIGSAASVALPLLAGKSQEKGIASANEANIQLQREQQDWQERMAGSEVQRRKEDFIAAGFNPMLAVSGAGASVGNVPPAQVESTKQNRLAAVNSALSAKMQVEQINNLKASRRLTDNQADLAGIEARMKAWEEPYGAFMAQNKVGMMDNALNTAVQQLKGIVQRYDIDLEDLKQNKLTTRQLEALYPVQLELARLDAQAKKFGLAGLENVAKFEQGMEGNAQWLRFIRELMR